MCFNFIFNFFQLIITKSIFKKEFKNDKEIGLIAMQKDKSVFKFLGEELKQNEEILEIKEA